MQQPKYKGYYGPDDKIDFGTKHRGKTIREIAKVEPTYIKWCLENLIWFDTHHRVTEWLELNFGKMNYDNCLLRKK